MTDPERIPQIEQRLRAVDDERVGLLAELRELRARQRPGSLALDRREYPSSSAEKVALFESLFVARKDVYPQYWESVSTGKKGYSPVCEAVWENGRRLKPTEIFIRYGLRKFQRLTAKVIEDHLRGRLIAGTYAIRPDDTCIFLAADFDGDGWQADAACYRDEASRMGIESLVCEITPCFTV